MPEFEIYKNEILSLYSQGMNPRAISKKLGTVYTSTYYFLKRAGVYSKRELVISAVKKENFIKDYESGMSLRKIGEKYNVCQSVASDYVRRWGLIARPQYRVKKINEKFFQTFTEESLWVLGWMFSDGNVCQTDNTMSISVHRNDIKILETIAKTMEYSEKSIREVPITKVCVLYFCHKQMREDLIKLGCVPKKSLIIKYPDYFTEDWQHWAFLRGVMEGDGHISKRKGLRSLDCQIASGSEDFLLGIKIFLDRVRIESYIYYGKIPSQMTLRISKHKFAMMFLDGIYKNGTATLFLKRKFDHYLKIKTASLVPIDFTHCNRSQYKKFYLLSPDNRVYYVSGITAFAREMSLPCRSIFRILKTNDSRDFSKKHGWSLPTPEQINTARANNTLIEKSY